MPAFEGILKSETGSGPINRFVIGLEDLLYVAHIVVVVAQTQKIGYLQLFQPEVERIVGVGNDADGGRVAAADGDVAGARQCIGATRPGGSEAHRVDAGSGVDVGGIRCRTVER